MEELPLLINDVSHYYCNATPAIRLIVSIQDDDLVYPFVVLGGGPVDYNPPLKGYKIFRVIILATQNGFAGCMLIQVQLCGV